MEDLHTIKEELFNYNENVRGVGTMANNQIVVYLKEEDLDFPKEYKGFKIITKVTGEVKLQ